MTEEIKQIELTKLLAHSDNPNRMSKVNFSKLVRNIERTGRYEPLIVRPHPKKKGFFQIINGHHRWLALKQLGYKEVGAVVWHVDDQQTEILLATLNRLTGSDVLDKKLSLIKKLTEKFPTAELGKLLPQSAKQLERLKDFSSLRDKLLSAPTKNDAKSLPVPLVFFVTAEQQKIVEDALSHVQAAGLTKAAQRAEALTEIARSYVKSRTSKGIAPK
jgi:ParB family chromosome partitioning protein